MGNTTRTSESSGLESNGKSSNISNDPGVLNGNNCDVEEPPDRCIQSPADFETAIEEAGFGLYNVLLMLVAVPSIMATYFETSTMSYIFSSAECDLNLTLTDKGLLNAVTYVGMISSAIIWGCVADAKGRKKALIMGFLVDVVCVIGGAASQNVYQLMGFKLLGGFIMGGPFAVLMSYISEMHGKKYRPRIMIITGTMFSISSLALPLMAIAILPQQNNFQFLGLEVHSWQVFLVASAVPSLLGGLLIIFFPESPKFLMSKGRNEEALKAFQRIYAMNNRQPMENYPIKELVREVPSKKEELETPSKVVLISTITSPPLPVPEKTMERTSLLRKIWKQSKPLFQKPYLRFSSQIYLMSFLILLGQNTMRLWLPQLFASIEEYSHLHGSVSSMCDILEYSVNKTMMVQEAGPKECQVIITVDTYFNNIIVALLNISGYILVGLVVNCVDVRRILNCALLLAGCCAIGLYFSASEVPTIIAAALYTASGSISSTSLVTASVNLFPTSLRTLIVSITMMIGRLGSIFGNVLFPELMIIGCIPPFVMVSAVMLIACILGFFLPNTNKLSLK